MPHVPPLIMAIHARAYRRLIINRRRYTWRVFAIWECDTWVGLKWMINECERGKTRRYRLHFNSRNVIRLVPWFRLNDAASSIGRYLNFNDQLRRYAYITWMNDILGAMIDDVDRDNKISMSTIFASRYTSQDAAILRCLLWSNTESLIADLRFNRIAKL